MEHRDRLEEALETPAVLDVLVGHVGEVLRVDPEIRVQVGDDHVFRVEAHRLQLAAEDRAAVGHRRRLADHDARQQRVFDVQEGTQPATELLLEPVDVLPTRPVALSGDDRHHLVFRRVVGFGDRPDRLAKDLVGLGVGRNQDGMHDSMRIERGR